MYQVIYSSIVVWCAILTWLFMGRALAKIQWVAIIGTSIGLGVSSFDSLQGSPLEDDFKTGNKKKKKKVCRRNINNKSSRINKCLIQRHFNDLVWNFNFRYV